MTTPCSNSAPIELWRTCATGSNCRTLSNIRNESPGDSGMNQLTFNYDSALQDIGPIPVIKKAPLWIDMASRTTSAPFGTYIDNNWNWVSVPSITGMASAEGWFRLTYTNPITKVTKTVGTTISDPNIPPILTVNDNALESYFTYVPISTTAPGRIVVKAFTPNTGGTVKTAANGRTFTTWASGYNTPGTSGTNYDIGDYSNDFGLPTDDIIEGSYVALFTYITGTNTTSNLALSVRLVNPTTPTQGGNAGNDPANNDPKDLALSAQSASCTTNTVAPTDTLFPESDAVVADRKNTNTTKWVIIGICLAVAAIVIIVCIIIVVVENKKSKKAQDLKKRVDEAQKIIGPTRSPPTRM